MKHVRVPYLVLAVLMAASLALGACAPATAPQAPAPAPAAQQPAAAPKAAEPVTIEIWDFQQSDKNILEAQQKAIDAFQKANPDIKVNVTVFPLAEYRAKLLTAVQGGKPPDISTLDQIWMAEWAASGAIVPLDEYIAKSGVKRDVMFPGAWDSNVWQGKTWGIPLNNDVWEELYYNKDMFKAAGLDPEKPPKDWDELLAYAKKLNNPPNQYGISIMGKGEWVSCIMDSFIYSNDGSVLNQDGTKAAINSPEAVAALKYLQELNKYASPGTAAADEAAGIPPFTTGKAAMVLAGSWQQDTFKGKPDLNWGIGMVPAPAGKTFHGTLGGWNMAIYNASKNKDAAWKYIEFLTNKDVQKTVNSLIPARLDAGKEFIDEGRQGAQVIFDTVNNGKPRPLSKVYTEVSTAQGNMMQDIWAGGDVQQAADKAAKAIDEAVAGK